MDSEMVSSHTDIHASLQKLCLEEDRMDHATSPTSPSVPFHTTLLGIHYDVRSLILESLLANPTRVRPEATKWSESSTYEDLLNVSSVCKQLHEEARPIFFKVNTFYLSRVGRARHRGQAYETIPPALLGMIAASEKILGLSSSCEAPRQPLPVKALANNAAWEFFTQRDWQERDLSRSSYDQLSLSIRVGSLTIKMLELRLAGYMFPPKMLETVFMIPSHLKLCKRHLEVHRKRHKQEVDGESSVHRISNLDLCSPEEPFAEETGCCSQFRDFSDISSRHGGWSIGWEIFQVQETQNIEQRGTVAPKCDWFNLHYCLEFHERFDKSDKHEKRKAWLLRLGGGNGPHEVL